MKLLLSQIISGSKHFDYSVRNFQLRQLREYFGIVGLESNTRKRQIIWPLNMMIFNLNYGCVSCSRIFSIHIRRASTNWRFIIELIRGFNRRLLCFELISKSVRIDLFRCDKALFSKCSVTFPFGKMSLISQSLSRFTKSSRFECLKDKLNRRLKISWYQMNINRRLADVFDINCNRLQKHDRLI